MSLSLPKLSTPHWLLPLKYRAKGWYIPIYTESRRRKAIQRRVERQRYIDQLSEVSVQPVRVQQGRVITVVAASTEVGPNTSAASVDVAQCIRPWLSSVRRTGLRGTVLHCGQIDKPLVTSDPNITFLSTTLNPGHLYCSRHEAVCRYLEQIDDPFVMITDGSDVAFKRDPFEVLLANRASHRLFFGQEERRIGECKYVYHQLIRLYGAISHADQYVLNPGILGGARQEVLRYLTLLVAEIQRLPRRRLGCDMGVVNKVLYDHYEPTDVFTGPPLHSRFRQWEFETEAAIIHK